MRKTKYIAVPAYSLIVFISILFITDVFAIETKLTEIKRLEEANKMVVLPAITRPKVEYNAEGLRDPFESQIPQESVPVVEAEVSGTQEIAGKPLPPLVIQGVIWGGSLPQAIINNKVVKAGDIIEGVRVISIDKAGITLLFEDKQYKLLSPAAATMLEKEPQGGQDEKSF